MNWLLINIRSLLLVSLFFSLPDALIASEEPAAFVSSDTTVKLPSFRFVPSSYMLQGAGGIGLVSAGFGWDYSKNKTWSTDVLVGFVPKYESDHVKFTFTLRQTYTPFRIALNDNFNYHLLRAGIYASTTSGRQFWFSAPDQYPSNYYTFSTKLRFNIFLGQDIDYTLQSTTSYFDRVKFYYDFHASDFNLIARIQNSYFKNLRYISLALGAKFYIRK